VLTLLRFCRGACTIREHLYTDVVLPTLWDVGKDSPFSVTRRPYVGSRNCDARSAAVGSTSPNGNGTRTEVPGLFLLPRAHEKSQIKQGWCGGGGIPKKVLGGTDSEYTFDDPVALAR